MLSFLDKEHIVAPAGWSRWRVAPAALAIHLSIGQAYAFSVFNLPLSRLGSSAAEWKLTELGWIFTCAIAFLGISAATFGTWVERVGPRKSGVAAAVSFASGLLIAALGVKMHALGVVIFGYGVVGGIGLGLGYITPVSTLIRWFPDRRGMATGIAIMGFGGGAIIAAPASRALMRRFVEAGSSSAGVVETFLVLGVVYFALMMLGAFTFRVPPADFGVPGFVAKASDDAFVTPSAAVRTSSFWFLWIVLCFNVTAGIGVLGQGSAMIQEVFKGRVDADDAATFVAALSASNMVGRFAWASLSDRIGRRATYALFFTLGPILYLAVPWLGARGGVAAFVACFCAILTMYGGGFATIPAYLADVFGTRYVSAIHGRLLTAWSVAGVLGPVLVNYIRQYQIERGVAKADAYDVTMRLMALLLVLAFFANRRVRDARPSEPGATVVHGASA